MQRINIAEIAATATNLNDRIEKNGPKDKVNAADINFNAIVTANWLQNLSIESDSKSDYDKLMFDKNGEVKLTGITQLIFDSKYEEHNITITMDDLLKDSITMEEVTIKITKATPEFGHNVKVYFQVQGHPSDDEYKFLRAAVLKEHLLVQVDEPVHPDNDEEQGDMLAETDDAA